MAAPKKTVAIVGRPNVGKSTLYNRLVGGRPALVHGTPGVTRDRRYGEVDYFGARFRVIDTGGLDPDAAREAIGAGIHRQAQVAIEEADAVLFLVDAVAGLTPVDRELAGKLRRTGRPVLLVANKVDSGKREALAGEAFELGMGDVHPVSAAHGRGVDEMLEALVALLGLKIGSEAEPEEPAAAEEEAGPVRVALVGKPNAGKSSLLNRLVGAERALVHHAPGTTTDPVDAPFEWGGKSYVLVDTAGMRRKARIEAEPEKLSVSLAIGAMERADVVVLMADVDEGVSEQDARIAQMVEESGRALVIALNKADLLGGAGAGAKAVEKAREEIHFAPWAEMVLISALKGDGVGALLEAVDRAGAAHRKRVATAELNRFFAEILETHPPQLYRGMEVRILYLTQGGTRPPTFLLFANRPEGVSPAYRKYVINQLRGRYGFAGTPLRLFAKSKKSPSGKRGGRRR
ncbi:MAG TPA: ribosome biogenesis GTPase Der [Kofleriaceae bacterium]|nr:ribosome biogenesis GTPase Der [Kofleriaceae bacterium]